MRRRPAAERRPGDDRCDVLRVAHRRGVARFAGGLRPVAIGLYPLAAVVPSGTVGSVVQADCRSRLRENLQSAMKTQVTPHRLLPGTPAAVDHKIAVGNPSGKFSDSQGAEVNWRSFRFEAEKTFRRDGACAAGHLLAVHPKANLTIDATYVVVIPLAGTAR